MVHWMIQWKNGIGVHCADHVIIANNKRAAFVLFQEMKWISEEGETIGLTTGFGEETEWTPIRNWDDFQKATTLLDRWDSDARFMDKHQDFKVWMKKKNVQDSLSIIRMVSPDYLSGERLDAHREWIGAWNDR